MVSEVPAVATVLEIADIPPLRAVSARPVSAVKPASGKALTGPMRTEKCQYGFRFR